MAPLPEEPSLSAECAGAARAYSGDDVVISGMSGTYPSSYSVMDLSNILYNKVNPINTDHARWNYAHPELPQPIGKVPELTRFDAQFFKVHYRLGNNMDPMSRKLLEQTYAAVYDAGYSPEQLSGKRVGVYIGSCFSETEKACFYVANNRNGFGIAGCSKAMFANRISYWLNLKGPSLSIDAACASSAMALERAYEAISRGDCEAAIVGGANICLHPQSSVHYGRIMTLCMDGKTKTFDKNADGCARGDAINILFLQRSASAKRIYATVCHVKSKFEPIHGEMGQKYGPYRDENQLASFMNDFYEVAKVPPSAVEYVETFGSAVPEADKSELEAISKVFCKDRINPLLVGSVMSNIGYSEAASTITAITKVLLSYHNGKIPANLHCDNPRDDVLALRDGSMKVVTEHQPFQRTYAGVNCMSVTGLNLHILLHGHYKPKDLTKYQANIPHLVTISGRQESGVQKILNDLKKRTIDPEEIALFHSIHEENISGHLGRGFTILGTNEENETVSLVEKVEYFNDAQRPLWFVYSGMGSQWATMGAQLMRIPVFAATIERCRKVLEPKGVDIVHIITSPDKKIFENILNSFVGIAACQIGLTDVLRALGLVPDKIIGHSVGELGCAYADGCFTAEEMILAAYSRGLVSVQTPFIHGSMAAVGVGYEQVKTMCPPEIEVACHNSSASSTISGPSDIMKEFVAELSAKGIFAKEVPCSNIAYHSRYIKDAGPDLLKLLREVIKSPKERSDRWLSTSVPQDNWDTPAAKYSSAEYHTNNLLNPVLFEETSSLVPSNAVLIEVAPHGLLQAILKRSLPVSCVNVPLTRRGHADNAVFLLEAIGKLYLQGYNPKLLSLYPKVEFPVSTGTPLLSHHVEWAHTEKWSLALYVAARRRMSAAANFIVSLHDDEHSHLRGNVHESDTLYPFSGALVCVWDTLAMMSGVIRSDLSVEFQNVHLNVQPLLYEDQNLRLRVQLHKGNGYFEVTSDNLTIASGYIHAETETGTKIFGELAVTQHDGLVLSSKDVYKIFHERGSYYKGELRSIKSVNEEMTEAQISWNGNWITLIDSMIQTNALRRVHDGVTHPRFIRRIFINTKEHLKAKILHLNDNNVPIDEKNICFEANYFKVQDATRCGGVVMEDIKFNDQPRTRSETVALKSVKFTPFIQYDTVKVSDAVNVFLQIVAENINDDTINVVELQTYQESCLQGEINKLIDSIPNVKIIYNVVKPENISSYAKNSFILSKAHLVLVKNLSTADNTCKLLHGVLTQGIFLLLNDVGETTIMPKALCQPVASASTPHGRLQLCRWRPAVTVSPSAAVSVYEASEFALLRSTRQCLRPDHRLVVLSRYPPPHGLKELLQKWRKDSERNKIYLAMINHNISKDQNLEQLPNFDLFLNVLDHGTWGGVYMVQPEEFGTYSERALVLRSAVAGDLNSLYWEEGSHVIKDELLVTVHYAGVNVRDTKSATGVIPSKQENEKDLGYGMDFSGVTDSGSRVMGVIRGGAVSSRVAAEASLLWPVPAHWTLEDAATVPLPYAHAFYILRIKSSLFPGMRVLVHGASGALGMALISIILAYECEVFATVSDVKKKRFLQRMFPALQEDHIGNSRDNTFGVMVKHQTKGKGCNFVICCLEGELKDESMNCLGVSSYMFDTSLIPNKENYDFGMTHLMGEKNYTPVDFSAIFSHNNTKEMELLQLLVSDGISRGYVRPLSRITYAPQDAARAFTLLANSRHRGRALLRIHGEVLIAALRLAISPTDTQIVLVRAADDTLTVRVINTLVARGATNVVLHRYAQHASTINAYMQIKIKTWQTHGVKVKISTENLTDVLSAQALVKDCAKLGPVQGVFVVTSGALDDKTQLELTKCIADMDAATRKLCPMLKYFIVVNEEGRVGEDLCINRANDRLPSTMLTLPKINTFEDWQSNMVDSDHRGISCAAAVEAMERAARATCSVLVAQTNKVTASNRAGGTVEPTGLSIFFDYIDHDELMATIDTVKMRTMTQSDMERDDEYVVNETNLVIIPGLEGHYSKFRVLCERLKLPAVVLQPGNDYPNETVQEMAERFVKVMLKKIKPQEKFYLLGYSFGVLVALEMALLLEQQGLVGVVYCVDAGPDTFTSTLESCLGDLTMLQDNLIQHMYQLMVGSASERLGKELRGLDTWKDKLEAGVRALRGHVRYSAQYSKSLIEAAYGRIEQARRYDGSQLLASPLGSALVLLRSRCQPTAAPHDLGLSRYSRSALAVYSLQEGHNTALTDLRAPNFINRHLDEEIQEAFLKKNLCETYLLNATTFMDRMEIDDDFVM